MKQSKNKTIVNKSKKCDPFINETVEFKQSSGAQEIKSSNQSSAVNTQVEQNLEGLVQLLGRDRDLNKTAPPVFKTYEKAKKATIVPEKLIGSHNPDMVEQ